MTLKHVKLQSYIEEASNEFLQKPLKITRHAALIISQSILD